MNEQERKQIQEQIDNLPKGIITVKKINGTPYEYWQFWENGKQISKRVKGAELEILRSQIEERKRLEKAIHDTEISGASQFRVLDQSFNTQVITGKALMEFTDVTKSYLTRECFEDLKDYIDSPPNDRILILYGLRRTGKTTLIRQMIRHMSEDKRSHCAFIQIVPGDTLDRLNKDLKLLQEKGYKYIFIDEVTLLDDFIEGAALFSDIFAASGIKIVLSGTDSLGFLFSQDEQLFDRCFFIHTTFIPYREFEHVLGIKGIDEYICHGGTMSMGGVDYNKTKMPFRSASSTNEYINSAIAHNIQHSLKNYKYEGHFRNLYELYERNELTNVINRVVEDMNHRFTLDVLNTAFKSHDLGISRNNLRSDRENPTDLLDDIDIDEVTERLRHLLEIRNHDEQEVLLKTVHLQEIEEYLKLLDLIDYVDIISSQGGKLIQERPIFTQPGLRYSQAEALISSLMQDEVFRNMGVKNRLRITDRILSEIKGRMMEDIVLLETKIAFPQHQVFIFKFAVGEFDMVVFDETSLSCKLYEIKHSSKIVHNQIRHLSSEEMCAEVEKQYGEICGKYVIYRGPDKNIDDIHYTNIENYLNSL